MSTTATTRAIDRTAIQATLYIAFELGNGSWKLGFTTGLGQRPRERNVPARDVEAVLGEIERARRRFALPREVRVVSCYEAGRDGFWLHRFLVHQGIENRVVDSSSIEVKRRQRRVRRRAGGSASCTAACGCRAWRRKMLASSTGSC